MFLPQLASWSVKLKPADSTMATPLLLFSVLFVCQTSAHSHASVTVTPNRSQYFEYEQVFVSCEQFGSSEWTVWRYTIKGLELSQCGSGWGNQTSSTCNMKTVKVSTSGVYWCESEYRDSSNAINITVTDKEVILQSPVLPVMEGHNVTLDCKTRTPASSSTAKFYKSDSFIKTEPTGHMTIWHFSKLDEGAYKCSVNGHESPSSWLLIKDESDPVCLTPFPDSSQRFEYENLSLSCGDNSKIRGWTVKRSTTSGRKMSSCGEAWGTRTQFGCILDTAKQPDSAVYWCESPARQRSNSVNISVYGTPVILQSPVLPVTEGGKVALHCRAKNSSKLPADFYKDGSLLRTEPTGHMTIHHVTKSDEGLYKCHISSRGESPPSWLLVRVSATQNASPATDSTVRTLTMIRHIVVCSPYFICTLLILSIYRQRPTGRTVSMMTPPHTDNDEELEPQYEDVITSVTTEHQF